MSPAGETYVIEGSDSRVRILDRRRRRLFEPMNAAEVLARDGWVEVSGDLSDVLTEAAELSQDLT
jgi:hypothetical protein